MYSHDYANGLKLMEHSYIGNAMMNVIEDLLSSGGDWYKNRIVWAGDYAETGRFLDPDERIYGEDAKPFLGQDINVYFYMQFAGTHITPGLVAEEGNYEEKIEMAERNVRNPSNRYICNWDKQQFVDTEKVSPVTYEGTDTEFFIHPLSLLTADGNGLGGGDFRGDNPHVGAWAGDRISVETEIPNGLNELVPHFKEG